MHDSGLYLHLLTTSLDEVLVLDENLPDSAYTNKIKGSGLKTSDHCWKMV